MEKLEVASLGTQGEIQATCGLCGGPHENHNCSLIREDQQVEQANYMGNQQRHDTEVNPKGECKAITLRSGKALEDISTKINIPFAEALEQMPLYAKFMKDLISKKRSWREEETIQL
ncbi:hypothetical protein PIB30_105633, partial [Stylosanthes scabra]|nr:hypothetical protein [Stylosanthes scabra]